MILFTLAIHYLTFDIYGTILNSSSLDETIKQIAIENECDPNSASKTYFLTEEEIMYGEDFMTLDKVINKSLFWTDTYLNKNIFQKNYERMIHAYKDLKPFPDVIDSLKELKSRGYTLIMMSNSMDMIMDENKKSLENLYDGSYLADRIKAYKPRIEFFQFVHKDLDFDNYNHTHIANGYWYDIEPVTKMNWKYKIWINRNGYKKSPEFDPQIEVFDLNEALKYLPNLHTEDEI